MRCNGDSWRTFGSLVRSAGVCDFQPDTSVTCQLRATNSAGNSARVPRTVTTQCDGKIHISGFSCISFFGMLAFNLPNLQSLLKV